MADEKNETSRIEATQKSLLETLSSLSIPPKPVVVEFEVNIVPKVFLVHPLTGEKREIKPQKREEITQQLKKDGV